MSEKKGGKEGFTLGLALLDAVPVVAFGVDMLLLSKPLDSKLFLIGAVVSFLAGGAMVFYKLCLAIAKKDYPICKKIMPVGMTAGWLMMIVGAILKRQNISFPGMWRAICTMPATLFFILGILCFVGFLVYFKTKFNADSAKDNWIEEIHNAGAQVFMMLGVIFSVL